jgi:hypothetical protein
MGEDYAMEKDLSTIVISAMTGAITSGAILILKNFLSLRTKIDESVRKDRIEVYKEIWRMMDLLPRWPRRDDVTYGKLKELSECFRRWYFERGGILLSVQSRKAYGDIQQSLCDIFQENAQKITEFILRPHYDVLRDLCHAFRDELTEDILSRKRAFQLMDLDSQLT